jgi:hypothetical protein
MPVKYSLTPFSVLECISKLGKSYDIMLADYRKRAVADDTGSALIIEKKVDQNRIKPMDSIGMEEWMYTDPSQNVRFGLTKSGSLQIQEMTTDVILWESNALWEGPKWVATYLKLVS